MRQNLANLEFLSTIHFSTTAGKFNTTELRLLYLPVLEMYLNWILLKQSLFLLVQSITGGRSQQRLHNVPRDLSLRNVAGLWNSTLRNVLITQLSCFSRVKGSVKVSFFLLSTCLKLPARHSIWSISWSINEWYCCLKSTENLLHCNPKLVGVSLANSFPRNSNKIKGKKCAMVQVNASWQRFKSSAHSPQTHLVNTGFFWVEWKLTGVIMDFY